MGPHFVEIRGAHAVKEIGLLAPELLLDSYKKKTPQLEDCGVRESSLSIRRRQLGKQQLFLEQEQASNPEAGQGHGRGLRNRRSTAIENKRGQRRSGAARVDGYRVDRQLEVLCISTGVREIDGFRREVEDPDASVERRCNAPKDCCNVRSRAYKRGRKQNVEGEITAIDAAGLIQTEGAQVERGHST